jgi:hypothetical protein
MIRASTIAAPGPMLRNAAPVLAAGAAAACLALAADSLGLSDMPLMAGCGADMLPASIAMALRVAIVMTVIGILVARPWLLRSRRGALTLAVWVMGLMAFALADQQAAIAGLTVRDPVAGWLLRTAPLLAGLVAAALVPRGQKACVAAMVVMTHAGLMTWPWMAGCAALTAWTETRHGRGCALRQRQNPSLSV